MNTVPVLLLDPSLPSPNSRIMASPNTPQPAHPGADLARRLQDAAHVLGRVFGEEVLAALHEGVLKGDLAGVVPLLTAAGAKPYLRAAVQDVFAAVCDAGEADAAALLLECDGIDGDAALKPSYVRYEQDDDLFAYNDEDDEEGDTVLSRAARP